MTACILSGNAEARRHRPDLEALRDNARAASSLLGMREPIFGTFPNIAFNTVPTLELVQFIEAAMEACQATTLITHHPADLNDDHLHTSRACQAAARLPQRKPGVPDLRELMFMEVLSSTDWSFPGTAASFAPNTYCEVAAEEVELKIRALECYHGVMRPSPHPRREEILRGLASLRGAQCGTAYAEAFQSVFMRWGSSPALQ